jgi:heme a synthase
MPSYPNYFYPSRLSSRYKSGAAIFPSHGATLASKEQVIMADLPPPWAQKWLFICAGLTVGVIVVGGITRLTESGLSITEWKPITGILPPMNDQAWMVEFDKYRLTPEFKL